MSKSDIAQVVSHEYRSAFIPAWLDDFGLDVYAFRVYARLKRRADNNGQSYESVRSMATAVGMSERRMQKAFVTLEERGLLKRQYREHQSTVYHLLQPTLRATAQGAGGGAPDAGGTAPHAGGGAPRADKGTPLKDSPLKVSTNKEKESARFFRNQAQEIIDTYNEHRASGDLAMPKVAALNAGREKKLKNVIKKYGVETAKELMVKACKDRLADRFYPENGHGLDALLVDERFVQYAEAYDHMKQQQPTQYTAAQRRQATEAATKEWLALTDDEANNTNFNDLVRTHLERMTE